MSNLRSVLIMAGGTGGHVFPGLAVANGLRKKGIAVNWLGTRAGIEARLVPEAGIPIFYISIAGLRGKRWQDWVTAPWRLFTAILQAMKIIHQLKPDVVLGLGGFASGPGGIACWLLRRPLVIHEQNAKPGITNKWLAHLAKKVLEGFPNTFLKRKNVITTGNPVRADIINLPSPQERFKVPHTPLRLLVIGGSLGAVAINQLLPKALATLPEHDRPEICHQTGEKYFDAAIKLYKETGVAADVKPFITDMAKAYAWADIVLCRAGALTIAELCAAGLGAILVPYPYAVDDHQTANAAFMVKNQAAWLIQQADLTEDQFIRLLKQFILDREKCFSMAQSAYKSRKIDATDHVIKICEEICS
jgi:UDP-N-acetylglucosamine--N-acetylmuramyl-(pentapeptide) pyrophosphoryl-undecaprenol N-acetylglucosamine transferase